MSSNAFADGAVRLRHVRLSRDLGMIASLSIWSPGNSRFPLGQQLDVSEPGGRDRSSSPSSGDNVAAGPATPVVLSAHVSGNLSVWDWETGDLMSVALRETSTATGLLRSFDDFLFFDSQSGRGDDSQCALLQVAENRALFARSDADQATFEQEVEKVRTERRARALTMSDDEEQMQLHLEVAGGSGEVTGVDAENGFFAEDGGFHMRDGLVKFLLDIATDDAEARGHKGEATKFFLTDVHRDGGVRGVSCGEDGAVMIWGWDDQNDMLSRVPETEFGLRGTDRSETGVLSVAVTTDYIVTGGCTGDVFVHTWTGDKVRVLNGSNNGAWVREILLVEVTDEMRAEHASRYSENDRVLALTACDDGSVGVFNLFTSRLIHRPKHHSDYVRSISAGVPGIACASDEGRVTLIRWDGSLIDSVDFHDSAWVTSSASCDDFVLTGGRDSSVVVMDWEGNMLHKYKGEKDDHPSDSGTFVMAATSAASHYGLAIFPDLTGGFAVGGRQSCMRLFGASSRMVKSATKRGAGRTDEMEQIG